MWRDNLLDIIKEKGLKTNQIAERGNLPIKTVQRVIRGETQFPTIDTLDRFATALGCTLGDILAGTRAVVGTKTLAELEEQINTQSAQIEELTTANKTLIAERDFAIAETALLNEEVKTLNHKLELLSMQLSYKDEIIALYKIIEAKANA